MRLTIPANEGTTIGQPLQTQKTIDIASGFANLAEATNQITGHLMQVAQEERDALTKNRSAKFYAEFGDYQDQLKTSVFNEVREGKLKVEDATAIFKERSDGWVKSQLGNYDEITKRVIEPNLPIFGLKALSEVRDQQAKLVSEDFQKGILQMGESYSRLAVKSPSDAIAQFGAYLDFAAPKANIDEVKKTQLMQTFKEKAWFDSKAFVIENSNSYSQLKSLRQELKDTNNITDLTPEGRRGLIGAVDQKLNQLDAQAKARKREYEQKRAEQGRFIIDALSSGSAVHPDILKEANTIAKGNDTLAKAMQGVISSYGDIRTMAIAPIQKQAELVSKAKEAIANESDPQKSAMLQDKYKILANAYTQNAKAIVDDVWSYDEQRTGKPHAPIDFTQPILPQIQANKKTADAIYARTGYPAPLVRANQMEDLKKFITALTPDKQVEFLGSLASVAGKDTAMATIKAIGANDMRLGSIALHAAEGHKTQSGKSTAAILARGFQILGNKDTLNAMRPSKDFYTEFNDSLDEKFGNMFFYDNPELKSVFYDNVMATYMYMASVGGKDAQMLDKDLFDSAVNVSTGGVVQYNGLTTIPPYGMDEDTFKDKADAAINSYINSTALGVDEADRIRKNSRLVPYKDGGYYLRLNGEIQLDPRTRQPVRVFIK